MRVPFRERKKHSVLIILCLLAFFSLAGDSSEKPVDTQSLKMLSPTATGSQPARAPQARTSNITLTVVVATGGVTVRLYDQFGYLVEKTAVLTPPAVATLRTPEGSTIQLSVPGGVFSGAAIIDIYMKGRREMRPIIEDADRKIMEKSAIPFGEMGPVEFVSTAEPEKMVTISLSYPAGSNPALLNSLRAYYLEKDDVSWLPVPTARLNPADRTVAFEVSSFEIFRLMTGSANDLQGVIVYPNPFRPRSAKDNVLKFIGLTDNVVIKIYTISGDLVWSKHIRYTGGGATWNGRNLEGREVSSGLYVYQITNANGEKNTGRISVIW